MTRDRAISTLTCLVNLSVLFDKPTGITTYARSVYPYLQPLEPTLLVADAVPDYPCHIIPPNLSPAAGSRGHLRRLLWTQFRVPSLCRKLQASFLFSPVPEAPLYRSCRYAVMVHDLIPLRFPQIFAASPLKYYFDYYVPQVVQQADCVVCNSEATARDICDFWGVSAAKVTPIPLACDRDHFRPLNLPPYQGLPYFLYIGRPDPYKNLKRLISAFATLGKDCELWIAGASDPRYTPILKEQTQSLNVEGRVKFLEYVSYDKLPILLNQALALVFPTLWEGFGIPVLEAMACGTPVITSNRSALPEVAGEAAILVDPYNTQELTAAMCLLIDDASLRSHFKTLGLQHVRQFSWQRTGQQTVEALQRYF
ncbi:MAG: glycosyltransferase family 1 protein [Jaaginema sp. PMC 1079.18]|nr:glycosyltransferase family 1 protein [Jaaginema sp. PMC 1080.18]MEC4849631.1 glycosyltransferase family 1 protein [Jaaginema sp. PMC 1079.18]MEC4864675.1 glycosyltransferase family 1 protein [Jaaginema sp. PMC 1078.18]